MKPLTLTVEDVSCTEVWLKISASGRNGFVIVQRDSIILDTLSLKTTDTTITDTGLLPSHTYTYKVILTGQVVTAQAVTMDTTSHNITWTSYTIGDASGGSGCLYDVAIINDTLAYAVGDFFSDGSEYNAAVWNGSEWTLKSITVNFRGNNVVLPLYGVFSFSANDIWFVGSLPIHGDGQNWTIYDLRLMSGLESISLTKAWGSSSTDMYFVGNTGSIVHYDGTSWTKIESGTSLDIRSIWGAKNTQTGNYEIYATAGNPLISPDRKILHISGNTVESISDSGINWGLNSLWFVPGKQYWIVGDGVWEKHPTLNVSSWSSKSLSSYTIDAVEGNEINDVFMCGAYGELLHFNGVSWKSYYTQTNINGAYLSMAVKGNTVIAVGEKSPQTVMLIGKRN
jgi:hypothetical protein